MQMLGNVQIQPVDSGIDLGRKNVNSVSEVRTDDQIQFLRV